jgi:hypothetical protein
MIDQIELQCVEKDSYKYSWLGEFYEAVGYAMFLAYLEQDSSLRQAYILLDNSVEQFIKMNLNSKLAKKKEYYQFYELISDAKQSNEEVSIVLDRVFEYHETRNILYHKSIYVTISKKRFKEYLNDVITLCDTLGFSDSKNILDKEFNRVINITYSIKLDKIYTYKNDLENQIKDNFGIAPGTYQGDIIIASPMGV